MDEIENQVSRQKKNKMFEPSTRHIGTEIPTQRIKNILQIIRVKKMEGKPNKM